MSLIVGDALAVLKELDSNSVDVGVTSPPYNKQENKRGWLVSNVKYDVASDKKQEDVYESEQVDVLNELYRVIKPGGSFFYNHKIRWERGVMLHPIMWLAKTCWAIRQEIVWDRGIAANIRGWRFWQVEERIYWLYKAESEKGLIGKELEARHAMLSSVWKVRPENKNLHPAPFPIEIPARCIYSILGDKKGVVVDPYCGSGTTLAAAKLLGHDFIGIDISAQYIESAGRRLEAADNEKERVEAEVERHVVRETFTEKKARGMYQKKRLKESSSRIEQFL